MLIFRSLWLCGCGADFEQTLYPDNVEVMFSACQDVMVHEVGGGTHLYVEGDDEYTAADVYLLDIVTGEKNPFTPALEPNDYEFITDKLLYVKESRNAINPHPAYILEWQTGQQASYKLLRSEQLPLPLDSNGTATQAMLDLFQPAEQVFYLRYWSTPFALTLVENWQERHDENLLISGGEFFEPEIEPDWLIQVLEASGKLYTTVPRKRYYVGRSSLPSHNGRFFADQSGVYDANTGEQIIDMRPVSAPLTRCPIRSGRFCVPAYIPCCWLADDNVVLYLFQPKTGGITNPYELLSPPTMRWQVGAPFQVSPLSMPVLKVTIPESYR
ncbi:MAG: hypothetical protein GY943_36925 [Chloroflexi bacterium]|nr:hypothetical protein [Chloroflexota bacterium]